MKSTMLKMPTPKYGAVHTPQPVAAQTFGARFRRQDTVITAGYPAPVISPKEKAMTDKDTKAEDAAPEKKRSWTEEIEVAGSDLVDRVKKLAAEGQVRRVRITEPDGDLILEIPLTIGAVAGGALVLAAPLLAAIGALAALVTKVKIEITRDGDKGSDKTS
jgi:hypothetical protein